MRLQFLNYTTIYSAISLEDNPEVKIPIRTDACFRSVFLALIDVEAAVQYKLILYTSPSPLEEHYRNNYCPFSKKEVRQHLKRAQKIVPELTSFSIEETTFKDVPCFEVTFVVGPASRLAHKYVLTWVRFLYECSFNIILMDALRLSKLPQFKFISTANLINLVTTCYPLIESYPVFNSGHGICYGGYYSKFLTNQEVRKRLMVCRDLNTIYKPNYSIEVPKLKGLAKAMDYEFWESDEEFMANRLPVYLQALQTFKREYAYCI